MMQRQGTSRRRVRRGLAIAAVAVLALDGGAAFRILAEVHAVTVSDAVARYRHLASTSQALAVASARTSSSSVSATAATVTRSKPAQASPIARPTTGAQPSGTTPTTAWSHMTPATATAIGPAQPGVYSYATTGQEHVSSFGGITHTYPATTTITITPSSCGEESRWQPLDARYDDYQFCSDGQGLALASLVTYHDFDGQVDKKTYRCDPGTMMRPDGHAAGTTFGGRCSTGNATAFLAGVVVGAETLRVGPSLVAAIHVRISERLTGAVEGTRATDMWWASNEDLPIRVVSSTDAPSAATTFGPTHYTEHYELALQSLAPAH